MKFKLGERLKDKVTGFSGIAVARTEYLTGCDRYSLQSEKLTTDGKPQEWASFDVDMLEKVDDGINHKVTSRGGPQPKLSAKPDAIY